MKLEGWFVEGNVSDLELSMRFGGTIWKCEIAQQEHSMPTGSCGVGLGDRNSL